MIYLIDDKKPRQEHDYNWTEERFEQFKDVITTIHTLETLQEHRKEVFKEGNIILYHESFIDKTSIKAEASERRKALDNFRKQNNSYLIIFSGSINTRNVIDNFANIPVSVLYSNLEIFIQKYRDRDLNLKYLLFGQNHVIEQELSIIMNSEINKTAQENLNNTDKNILFIRSDENYISQPFNKYDELIFYDNISDTDFTEAILTSLDRDVYDNIFIPLCFGNTLSDFNGLRLACHIRCTKSKNQTTRIFIYGIVGIDYLLQNEYFNILKTKNTYLIPFSKKSIGEAVQIKQETYNLEELPIEIAKLKLDVPEDYEDNHSIANEWAIYRWSKTIKAEDDAIEILSHKINSNLYFKYLTTIYPISDSQRLKESDMRLKMSGAPKVLYIDDEAEKGWYEIFCKILVDLNNVDFYCIGDDFKNQTEEQIIDNSLNKVKEFNSDIVILDFRLHHRDFAKSDIDSILGIRVLKKIKKFNPGIQVIIFSATNKIWNLQALNKAEIDSFIFKERPGSSLDFDVTKKSIKLLLSTLEERSEFCFLKSFYERFDQLQKELLPRKNFKKTPNPLPKEFVDETLKWFKLSIDHLKEKIDDSKKAASFLFLFSVLENLSTRTIDVDNPIDEGKLRNGKKIFKYEFRSTKNRLRNYIEDANNLGFYRRTNSVLECGRSIPWNLKILNTLDFITDEQIDESLLSQIIKKRNDFIHSNITTGDRFTISNQDIIWLNEKIFNGLMKVI